MPKKHPRHPTVVASLISSLVLLSILGCHPSSGIDDVRALQDAGRYRESLEPLRVMLAENPSEAEIHYLYGTALRRTGQAGLAIWSLEKATQDPEWERVSLMELSSAALANRSFPTAIQAATRLLELDAENKVALSIRGSAYLGDRTKPEAALDDFERALELDPENFNLRVQRASALLLLKRVEEAQEAILELQSQGDEKSMTASETAHVCVARATFAFERGDLDEAAKGFESCLEASPTSWTVVSEAIPFFDGIGRPERSEEILRAAIESEPTAVVYRSALAERLLARGKKDEAETMLRAGTELEDARSASESWAALATLHLADSDYQAAARDYERSLEFVPEPSQQELLDYADLLSLAGQYDRALEIAEGFERPVFRDLIHARVLLERDRPEEALERLDAAVRLWPDNASARYYAGRAAEQLGRFDRAINEFRQAIRAGGDHTDAAMRLARILEAEGSHHASLVAVGHRLRSHPSDVEALLFALEVSEKLKNRSQAVAYLSAAQARPAVWARAFEISAEALARRRGPEAAIEALLARGEAQLIQPRNAPLLRALVRQLKAANRLDEATPLLTSALEAHPESADLHALRGELAKLRGAPMATQREAYQKALGLDPENLHALEGLAEVEAEAGKMESAASLFDRAAALDPADPSNAFAAALLLAQEGGQNAEAEQRMEALLREHPYYAPCALALARLRIARDADATRTIELGQRAARFGSEPEANRLLLDLGSMSGGALPPRS